MYNDHVILYKYIQTKNLNVENNLTSAIIIPDKDIIPGAETLSPAYVIFSNYEKLKIKPDAYY